MKKLSLAVLFFIIVANMSQCWKKEQLFDSPNDFLEEVSSQVKGISPAELRSIIDSAEFYVLIDVREKAEHDSGYIAGSVNLSRGLLEFRFHDQIFWLGNNMEKPYFDDLIIVYGKKNERGILSASTIQKMGYRNVRYLEGGYKNWETNYPKDYVRNN